MRQVDRVCRWREKNGFNEEKETESARRRVRERGRWQKEYHVLGVSSG